MIGKLQIDPEYYKMTTKWIGNISQHSLKQVALSDVKSK